MEETNKTYNDEKIYVWKSGGPVLVKKPVKRQGNSFVTCQTLPFVFLASAGLATIIWLLQNGLLP